MDAEPNSSSASSNSSGSSNNSSSSNLLAQLPMLQAQVAAAAVADGDDAVAVPADQPLHPPLDAVEVGAAADNAVFISPLLFNNNATPPPSTSASSSSSSSSSSSHNLLQLYQHHHDHDHDHEQQHDGEQQEPQSDLHHHHRHHHRHHYRPHHAPELVHAHEAESEHAHRHSHSPSPSSHHQQHQHHASSSPYAPLHQQPYQHHRHHQSQQHERHDEEEEEEEEELRHRDEPDRHSLLDDNAIADTIDVEAAGINDVGDDDVGDDVLSAEPASGAAAAAVPSTSSQQNEQLTTGASSADAAAAGNETPLLLREEPKQSPSQPPGYSTHFSYPYAQVHPHYFHNHHAHYQQHEHQQQQQPHHHHHHSSFGVCSNIYGFEAASRGNGATMFSHIVAVNDGPQTSSGLPSGHSQSHGHGQGNGGGGGSGGSGSGSGSGSSGSRHHHHHHHVDRLKMLYPNVNETDTPLPRCWSPHDKCLAIGLSQNNLRVHYKGLNKQQNDAASVRTAYPIPASCGLYYFEVKIISKGKNGYMGIGLTAQQFRMNRLPGWDKQSYGYHGDDGNSFSSSGNGQSYGPKFSTGDIIGCCINFVNNTCFYTKNGVDLGIAFRDLPTKLYPTVGLQTPGEEVDANFGQEPFKFDQIEEMMKQMRAETKAAIYEFPLPSSQGDPTVLLHDMVSSYLVHNGYSQTADAFGRATGQTFREDMSSIRNRQKILKLIMCGRMGNAIELTLRSYPGLLEHNQNLWFMLKCRQFVEMVNGSDVETSVIQSTRRFNQNGTAAPDDSNASDSASAGDGTATGAGVCDAHAKTNNAPPVDNGTSSSSMPSLPPTPMAMVATSPLPPSPHPAVIHADNQHDLPAQQQEHQEQPELCSQQELKAAASSLNSVAGGDAKNHVDGFNNSSTSRNSTARTTTSANMDYANDVDMENGVSGGATAAGATDAPTTNGIGGTIASIVAAANTLPRVSRFQNFNSSVDLEEEMDIDVSPSTSRFSNGIERILEFGKELSLMGQHLEKEQQMSDDDRQMLEDAFSLIAYSNPWSSPLGWQLCPTKRESVCTALNSAILESMNYPRRPPLDVCVAHASELLKVMAQSSLGACAFVNVNDVFPRN